MINKDGGGAIFGFYGGDTAVMRGDIELMGESPSPPPPTRENPVAHDKPIPHAKENTEISTDVNGNDVFMLKFERFSRKALNFKRLYLSSLWMKLSKFW